MQCKSLWIKASAKCVNVNVRKGKDVMCGQVWWPILRICTLHLTHPSAHTQQWVVNKTHTLWTHTRSRIGLRITFFKCLVSFHHLLTWKELCCFIVLCKSQYIFFSILLYMHISRMCVCVCIYINTQTHTHIYIYIYIYIYMYVYVICVMCVYTQGQYSGCISHLCRCQSADTCWIHIHARVWKCIHFFCLTCENNHTSHKALRRTLSLTLPKRCWWK